MTSLLIHGRGFGTVAPALIEAMHRQRHRVFHDRLGWVEDSGGRERDVFDDCDPIYLLLADEERVLGSLRLLPTTGPNMLRDVFPAVLDGIPAPADPLIWESSRFSVDIEAATARGTRGIGAVTSTLIAGIYEFALAVGLTHVVSVYDRKIAKILRRAGCVATVLGQPTAVGSEVAMAGLFPMTADTLTVIRAIGGLDNPVLALGQPRRKARAA